MKFFDRWALLFNTNRLHRNTKPIDLQRLKKMSIFLQYVPFASRMFIGDSKISFFVSLRRVRRVDGGGREKTFSFYNTTFAKGAQMYYLCNRHKGKTVIIDRFALVFFIKKRCFCKRMPYFFLALDGENPSLGVSSSGGDVVEKNSRLVKLSYKLFLTHKPSYDSSFSLQAVG